MITEHSFASPTETTAALAQDIAARLNDAIAARGVALIAVSGGRSPAALFDALRSEAIEWSKVIVAQVDERWVDPSHPDSNSQLIRQHLLQGPAAAARFLPMKNDAPDAKAGQRECEAALAALPRPFDIMLLGMGEDGHTASLFPGSPQLAEGLTTQALCLAATPTANPPHERMTLSLKGLLDSRCIILQLAGASKIAVYRKAMEDGAVEDMPVRAALKQDSVPVHVWISEI